jgi:hypothetical protein
MQLTVETKPSISLLASPVSVAVATDHDCARRSRCGMRVSASSGNPGGNSLDLRGCSCSGDLGYTGSRDSAKKRMPSRSEVTDAAMGERAECVMLNKGPYVVAAVSVLADILTRMQAHQNKSSRCCADFMSLPLRFGE